jgi:hypothetical protein
MAEPGAVVMKMREREELLRWSGAMERSGAPLFALLYKQIADNDELFTLSLEAPPEQLSGRMLIAAVHLMLLRSPDHELAAYFPSITADPLPAVDAGRHFRAFCHENRDELADIVRTHTLQTTSAGRAAEVLLAFDHVSRTIGEPFSIVEVGCSAGLLLAFDHYRYQFPNGETLGNAEAAVVISAFELAGERALVPTAFPRIVHRVGLDLNPVDVTDADARNWILGCSSADHVSRFNALRTALEYRARVPLNIVAGDAMNTLPGVLDGIDGPVCVFHSRCLYQWPLAAQEAFSAMLGRLSQRRALHRIGIEWRADHGDASATAGRGLNEIRQTIYRSGESETRVLGQVTRKSRIEWLA